MYTLTFVLDCIAKYMPKPILIENGILQDVFIYPGHLQLSDYPQTAVSFKDNHHVRDLAAEPLVCGRPVVTEDGVYAARTCHHVPYILYETKLDT